MCLGIIAAVVTAAIFGLVALRSEGVGFIIMTIALNEIVWGLAYQWVSVSGGDNGITGIVRPPVGPFDVSANTGYYYVCLSFFVISLILLSVIVRSPFGLVLKGVRETPRRMRALGYNVWFYRYLAMMISAGFAGLAGVLFAWYNQFVGPVSLSLDQSTQILIMVILGGIGTLYGQLFGALVVVFLSNELSAVTQRWEMVLGVVYFVVVMYAPGGLVVLVPRLWARLRGLRAGGGRDRERPSAGTGRRGRELSRARRRLQAIRQPERARRRLVRHRCGRAVRDHRAQRRRKVDPVQHHRGRAAAHARQGAASSAAT